MHHKGISWVGWSSEYSMGCLQFLSKWSKPWVAFSLRFGRDVCISTLANLLQPKLQYLGYKSLLSMEMPREAYMLTAINLKRVRDKQPSKRTKTLQNLRSEILYF